MKNKSDNDKKSLLRRLPPLLVVLQMLTATGHSAILPNKAPQSSDDELNIRSRVSAIRKAMMVPKNPKQPSDPSVRPLQWGNWVNWGNWPNWGKWNNWNNWNNWLNFWSNWHNF